MDMNTQMKSSMICTSSHRQIASIPEDSVIQPSASTTRKFYSASHGTVFGKGHELVVPSRYPSSLALCSGTSDRVSSVIAELVKEKAGDKFANVSDEVVRDYFQDSVDQFVRDNYSVEVPSPSLNTHIAFNKIGHFQKIGSFYIRGSRRKVMSRWIEVVSNNEIMVCAPEKNVILCFTYSGKINREIKFDIMNFPTQIAKTQKDDYIILCNQNKVLVVLDKGFKYKATLNGTDWYFIVTICVYGISDVLVLDKNMKHSKLTIHFLCIDKFRVRRKIDIHEPLSEVLPQFKADDVNIWDTLAETEDKNILYCSNAVGKVTKIDISSETARCFDLSNILSEQGAKGNTTVSGKSQVRFHRPSRIMSDTQHNILLLDGTDKLFCYHHNTGRWSSFDKKFRACCFDVFGEYLFTLKVTGKVKVYKISERR